MRHLVNPHWSTAQEIAHCRAMQREWRMKELFLEHDGAHDRVLTAVAHEFGWTEPQAYLATEFLYRPENMN